MLLWPLLTWCIHHLSNAWSQKSPQRPNWLGCEWQQHPPFPSHRTVTQRLHNWEVFNKNISQMASEIHLPLLYSPHSSQKQLPAQVCTCMHVPKDPKHINLSFQLSPFLELFRTYGGVFSYRSFVWVVALFHQPLVVHDVFKCLTGKASRKQITIVKIETLWKEEGQKCLTLTRYSHGCWSPGHSLPAVVLTNINMKIKGDCKFCFQMKHQIC